MFLYYSVWLISINMFLSYRNLLFDTFHLVNIFYNLRFITNFFLTFQIKVHVQFFWLNNHFLSWLFPITHTNLIVILFLLCLNSLLEFIIMWPWPKTWPITILYILLRDLLLLNIIESEANLYSIFKIINVGLISRLLINIKILTHFDIPLVLSSSIGQVFTLLKTCHCLFKS
jgi:hypothetical protein